MSKKKPYTPCNRDHIHTPGDCRGAREVYLNGGRISHVLYADTRKGIVRYCPAPVRINRRRGDCVLTRTKRGKVTVKWLTT